jgi:hypothetical protein
MPSVKLKGAAFNVEMGIVQLVEEITERSFSPSQFCNSLLNVVMSNA